MLKISFSQTPSEERWNLQGRLTAPWVRQLRASWKKNHRRGKQRVCIVDMNEITFIDKRGERLLRLLVKEGAQCIATRDYTKHIPEKLTAKGKSSILNRLADCFLAAVAAAFTVRFAAECIATGVYIKQVFEQLILKGRSSIFSRLNVH
jgi:hypothetical protein